MLHNKKVVFICLICCFACKNISDQYNLLIKLYWSVIFLKASELGPDWAVAPGGDSDGAVQASCGGGEERRKNWRGRRRRPQSDVTFHPAGVNLSKLHIYFKYEGVLSYWQLFLFLGKTKWGNLFSFQNERYLIVLKIFTILIMNQLNFSLLITKRKIVSMFKFLPFDRKIYHYE